MATPVRPAITPELTVGDLLAAYPELEPVLVVQSPAFAKLRNPVLRRTVARVATLAQAARVGGIAVRDLVNTLRASVGQDAVAVNDTPAGGGTVPPWYEPALVRLVLNADDMLKRGEHPLGPAITAFRDLDDEGLLCVDASFVPAPLIDALRSKGAEVESFAVPGGYRTCIRKAAGPLV